MPYAYDTDKKLTSAEEDIRKLTAQLLKAKKDKTTDSPVYQLVSGISFQNSVAQEIAAIDCSDIFLWMSRGRMLLPV